MVEEFLEELAATTEEKSNKRLVRRKRNWTKFNQRFEFLKALGLVVSAFSKRELGRLKSHGWVKKVDTPKKFKWSYDFFGERQPKSLQTELYQERKIESQGIFEAVIDFNSEREYLDDKPITIGEALFTDLKFWFGR